MLFFGKEVSNRSSVPNLKFIALTVAEIRRGSQIFLEASLAQTPANFGRKRFFFGKLVPKPSCVPNLKLLASMVAKIRRGSQFFSDAPLVQTPSKSSILVQNVVFC